MKPRDRQRGLRLATELQRIDAHVLQLPGIHPPGHLDCLVEQLVESLRRIEFVHWVRDNPHDLRRMDPHSDLFDPLRAAALRFRRGEFDEAYWLTFIATHFGKHARDGWRLARDIYGKLGGPGLWDWKTISGNPAAFRVWLKANESRLSGGDGVSRRFSNHRKYESLKASSRAGTAAVFDSYVQWVRPPRTHQDLIREVHKLVGQNPQEVFNHLYHQMNAVRRFGRLAKFDYLTMLGKLGIAPIDPGSAYLGEATGPLRGARLLFTGNVSSAISGKSLDQRLLNLDSHLNLGMQTLEDAICNWQKSPAKFISFKG
jgi:hypothetical protein